MTNKIKKAAIPGRRAWRLLRLAILWARKRGALKRGALKRGAFLELLRIKPGLLKSLRPGGGRADRIPFGEREFSFEETPAFHFKTPSMRLLRLPCITPAVAEFDGEDWDDLVFAKRDTNSFLEEKEFEELEGVGEEEAGGGVDSKAEEFIKQFYEQIKMQRQISLLQYNEVRPRSLN